MTASLSLTAAVGAIMLVVVPATTLVIHGAFALFGY
jgi:hypothetical protein